MYHSCWAHTSSELPKRKLGLLQSERMVFMSSARAPSAVTAAAPPAVREAPEEEEGQL